MKLFDRAKDISLSAALQWLPPGGRMSGDEYQCLNPLRADSSIGSFSINLKTGRWSEFADDIGGNDLISCYAYLNRSSLEIKARDSGYRNIDGGIQAEAARELLSQFDGSYFPGQDDDFAPPAETKKKGDFWDGFRQITNGIKETVDPMDTLKFFEQHWGEFRKHWTFTDKKGVPVFLVARYYDKDGKKNDRPFTPWTDGTTIKWRAKNLDGVKLPLYNLKGIEEEQNLPILLTEGQNNAEHGRELLAGALITSSVYRSPEKSDLEPLRGRSVFYWFDPDAAGRKKLKKIKDLLVAMDCRFNAVHSPTGKAKGWDLSDAIGEGWDRDQIVAHVSEQVTAAVADPEADDYLDTTEFPFRIVGQTASDFFFLTEETCLVMKMKRNGLTKANLMNLMDRDIWGTFYTQPTGGIAWDTAANHMIRKGGQAPIYSPLMVRGAGAWVEDGQLVINSGSSLIVNGDERPLFQRDTKFIYERKKMLPYRVSDPAPAGWLNQVTGLLDFNTSDHGRFLAGWLLLAPFGGALPWRPHVWLSGSQGAGKSYILDKIVSRVIGAFSVMCNGSSSTAGIRQALMSSTMPMVQDEAEGDTVKKREVIEESLSLARQASSGGENSLGILHGSQDGQGTVWLVGSMFLFASIGATIIHSADRNRITQLKLRTPLPSRAEERKKRFVLLREEIGKITDEAVAGMHARTLGLFSEVLKAIDVFAEETGAILGTRRQGDQVGTLMAGSWMIDHDVAPTRAEAIRYCETFDLIRTGGEVEDKQDGDLCMEEIMTYQLDVDSKKMTIGSWLKLWFARRGAAFVDVSEFADVNQFELSTVKRALEEYGIKPKADGAINTVQIAIRHPQVQRILRSTPWPNTYDEVMERVPYCSGGKLGPAFFGSVRKRYYSFDATAFLVSEASEADSMEDIPF